MEDKAAKIYKEFTFLIWKVALVMIGFIIIISAIIALVVETWNIQRTIVSVRNILYKECDADLFLEISAYGLKYTANQSDHKKEKIKNKYKLVLWSNTDVGRYETESLL